MLRLTSANFVKAEIQGTMEGEYESEHANGTLFTTREALHSPPNMTSSHENVLPAVEASFADNQDVGRNAVVGSEATRLDTDAAHDQDELDAASDTATLPPYEQVSALDPQLTTLDQRLSAPNMSGAFPIRIKAKQVNQTYWEFGRLHSPCMRRFEELMLISPYMSIHDFKRTFKQKVTALHNSYGGPASRTIKEDEVVFLELWATWEVIHPLGASDKRVTATLQNWPDIVAGLAAEKFRRLKVVYSVRERGLPRFGGWYDSSCAAWGIDSPRAIL